MENSAAHKLLEKYLESLCKHLESQNELERNRIQVMVDSNKALAAQIQNAYAQSSKSLNPLTSLLVTQETTLASLQDCQVHLSTKLEQIRKSTEALEQRMKDETKRFRVSLHALLNFNDVSVQPYNDVKKATDELEKKMQQMAEEAEKDKQKATEELSCIQSKYTTVMQTIANLEVVKKELSLNTTILQNKVNEKFAALNIDPTTDLQTLQVEEEKLRKEICELSAKLNKQNKIKQNKF